MTTISQSAHARAPQPRALIMSVYGLYARGDDGWLSIAALIRLLGELDVDEPAVRSAVSRLKRRGILEPARVGDAAGYALSGPARLILGEGDRRIFERRRVTPSEGWLLAVFSVPEAERHRRHLLRSRLTWLGFGTVSAGVRVAPAHVEAETRAVLGRDGLASYVDLFRAEHLAVVPGSDGGGAGGSGGGASGSGSGDGGRSRVAAWWDLTALEALYDEFLAAYRPTLAAWRRRRRPDDAAAFTDHTLAVTAWRRLPFLDPGLAADLLPDQWHGAAAADLFFALHERLAEPARRHVRLLTHKAPTSNAP